MTSRIIHKDYKLIFCIVCDEILYASEHKICAECIDEIIQNKKLLIQIKKINKLKKI